MKDKNVINDETFQLLQDLIMINGMGWNTEAQKIAYTEARDRLYKHAKILYLQHELNNLKNENS
jgi:hypothetical protein